MTDSTKPPPGELPQSIGERLAEEILKGSPLRERAARLEAGQGHLAAFDRAREAYEAARRAHDGRALVFAIEAKLRALEDGLEDLQADVIFDPAPLLYEVEGDVAWLQGLGYDILDERLAALHERVARGKGSA